MVIDSLLTRNICKSFAKNGFLLVVGKLDDTFEPIASTYIRNTLSQSECQRLSQIKDSLAAWQFAAGRILLRILVGEIIGKKSKSVAVKVSESGRPEIIAPVPLAVSLSHSGPYIAVVIARGQRCGVDIETKKEICGPLPTHERFFSEREIAWINQDSNECDRVSRFLRIWTRKESYLKATGEGLAGLGASLGFEALDANFSRVRRDANPTDCGSEFWVADCGSGDEYCLSVCSERPFDRIEHFTLNLARLQAQI